MNARLVVFSMVNMLLSFFQNGCAYGDIDTGKQDALILTYVHPLTNTRNKILFKCYGWSCQNLTTMSRVAPDETPATVQLIRGKTRGTRCHGIHNLYIILPK